MVNIFEYIVLASRRRSDDYDNWLQFLVFIVVAAFSIINAVIAKARSDKKNQKTQTTGQKQSKPSPSLTIKSARDYLKKIIELETGNKIPQPVAKPVQVSKTESKKPVISAPVKGDSSKTEKSPTEKTPIEIETVSPVLFEIGDSESLKRAIVHLEVFGKPLALRGFTTPADQF